MRKRNKSQSSRLIHTVDYNGRHVRPGTEAECIPQTQTVTLVGQGFRVRDVTLEDCAPLIKRQVCNL